MQRKPKLLNTSLVLLSGVIILSFMPYESHAVEIKKSSVLCGKQESTYNRGLENEPTITPTVVPVVIESNKIHSMSEKTNDTIYMWTNTDKVNLRSEASTNSDIIQTINKRTKVKVQKITSSDKWMKVEYKEETGYIYSKYLRDTELPSLEFTDEEIDLLAKILWLEARGEKDDSGLAAIIFVITNRINSVEFPDNLYDVLSEKNAFSSWKLLDTAHPDNREYEIIDETMHGEYKGLLTDDTVYFSTSPRNDNITAHIGAHYFCRED